MAPTNSDPYVHLPALRGRVKPAAESALRVTPAVLAMWDERARQLGRPADWRWTDAAVEASRQALLGGWPAAQDLWVYGYGSLMWDPAIHYTEVRRAELDAHRRRFTFSTVIGRGSPEQPGLMLSLEAQGSEPCSGLAFRIPAALVDEETRFIWRREMLRGAYRPALRPVRTPQGPVQALVFTSNPTHADYRGELPPAETAQMIARGRGVMGSNRDYLEQLAAQLVHLDIADAYIVQLLAQVRALGTG